MLAPGQITAIEAWLENTHTPVFYIPVHTGAPAYAYPDFRDANYEVVEITRRRMILPAPWTGPDELAYMTDVALYDHKPIAATPSRLVSTGAPYYDPRMIHPNGFRFRLAL